jgi:hypothetical protein
MTQKVVTNDEVVTGPTHFLLFSLHLKEMSWREPGTSPTGGKGPDHYPQLREIVSYYATLEFPRFSIRKAALLTTVN